ncbi:MAG: diaminopimelate epimerase [Defluviitaleaceae bacterium]|nr:diaminopimelate epimerase [Defluviitaleaceae bacterium]MCL2274052.1 diaminopimelate epimerase [Defluviitaleaceae bacterium]
MNLPFSKMHGCGNDYVCIDGFKNTVELTPAFVRKLANRHYGIGADGVVLIAPSDEADALMRMFNPDGSESNMCGNAIRCTAKYVYEAGYATQKEMKIETRSGIKPICVTVEDNQVTHAMVNMGQAAFSSDSLELNGTSHLFTRVDMGNPHAVFFCDDVDNFPVAEMGKQIEMHPAFPRRTNVEFAQITGKNKLKLRVWERGAGETLACGTGTCAAAVAAVENGFCDENTDIAVTLRGGELTICYTRDRVTMHGECIFVFNGVIAI